MQNRMDNPKQKACPIAAKKFCGSRLLPFACLVAALAILAGYTFVAYPSLQGQGLGVAAAQPFFAQEAQAGKISINTAAQQELTALPGIGEKRAAAIIEYRQTHGKFDSIEQLLEVPGIGEKVFANIRELVCL